jgi:hypothetical protein
MAKSNCAVLYRFSLPTVVVTALSQVFLVYEGYHLAIFDYGARSTIFLKNGFWALQK